MQIIGQWTENQPLRDTLMEFVKHRRAIKKPMTEYALKRLFPKLKSIAGSEEEQIEVLSQSIVNGWQGVFAPRDQQSWQSDKSGSATNATITDDEYLRMKREHEERLRRKCRQGQQPRNLNAKNQVGPMMMTPDADDSIERLRPETTVEPTRSNIALTTKNCVADGSPGEKRNT